MAFDRRQRGTFRKSFEEYAATRVGPARIKRAEDADAAACRAARARRARFGVPKELLMAIWTMETDNGGGDMGKLPVIRTLATLAHDCRRTELFQRELIAALKILQRGDLPLRDLIGAYAGEIGQTQFLPSSYIKYGVDFDGNGHVDLRHSVPDVLASTANLLKTNGWQRRRSRSTQGTREFRGDARVEHVGALSPRAGAVRARARRLALAVAGRCARPHSPLAASATSTGLSRHTPETSSSDSRPSAGRCGRCRAGYGCSWRSPGDSPPPDRTPPSSVPVLVTIGAGNTCAASSCAM